MKILLIEDNIDDVDYLKEILAGETRPAFKIENIPRLADGLDLISKNGIDLVLLDLSLPDSGQMETIGKMSPVALYVPVIVLTGLDDEKIGLRAIQEGMQDYLVKGRFDRPMLTRSILYAVRRFQIAESLREGEERFKEEFAVNLVRDLLTPLTLIKSSLDSLRDVVGGSISKKEMEFVEMAGLHSDSAAKIIRTNMDFFRQRSRAGRKARRPFLSILREAVQKAEQCQSPLTLMAVSVSNLEEIKLRCDDGEIERMFRNMEQRIGSVIRTTDLIDRFAWQRIVVLTETNRDESLAILSRIRTRLFGCSCAGSQGTILAICRVRMATYGEDARDMEQLLEVALR